MRKPWEEAGSHRDDFSFEDRPRRSDRRFDDREGVKRRSDRRFDRKEEGFSRREGNFERRDRRRDDRRGGFNKRRDEFGDNLYGVRSGPRARAAMAGRGTTVRRQAAPSRNALITLDADVARVFATSEAVNAALRHFEEKVVEEKTEETKPVPVGEFQSTDEDEEWFDLPVEGDKEE